MLGLIRLPLLRLRGPSPTDRGRRRARTRRSIAPKGSSRVPRPPTGADPSASDGRVRTPGSVVLFALVGAECVRFDLRPSTSSTRGSTTPDTPARGERCIECRFGGPSPHNAKLEATAPPAPPTRPTRRGSRSVRARPGSSQRCVVRGGRPGPSDGRPTCRAVDRDRGYHVVAIGTAHLARSE
jgi:hypothetical protein